jgi:uncharacterized repeat protein (TIGR03803 family)
VSAAPETVLYSFCSQQNCADGAVPYSKLIQVNGILYGTTVYGGNGPCNNNGTPGCGTVYSIDPTTAKETVLYSFCSQQNCTDGETPFLGSLIFKDGTLYGTTDDGGSNNSGTVFALDLTTGRERVLYSFCSQTNCTDGENPLAGLFELQGKLYGTTESGGNTSCSGGCGTIFSVDPATGREAVVYSFKGGNDGADPHAGLMYLDGNRTLYGTTFEGGGTGCGSFGCGTVYSLDPRTDTESVVYSFCSQKNCADGSEPDEGSLVDVEGWLYGTTSEGGAGDCNDYGCGTVFYLDPATGALRVQFSFAGYPSDGEYPVAGLIQRTETMYGTTDLGGTQNSGTLFSFGRGSLKDDVFYSFCSQQNCTDGEYPFSGVASVNRSLYGTTSAGGTSTGCSGSGCGTVFVFQP